MTGQSKSVSISYKKMPEFHSFWASSRGNQWLFVNAASARKGVESVLARLNEVMGGEWQPEKGVLQLIEKMEHDQNLAKLLGKGCSSVNTNWVLKAA